jgi:hypothetical protein
MDGTYIEREFGNSARGWYVFEHGHLKNLQEGCQSLTMRKQRRRRGGSWWVGWLRSVVVMVS